MRVWARRLLALVAWAFVIAIVIQVLIAGLAVFDGPGWWVRHVWWLHRFEWLTVVIVVLAYVARATRAVKWLAWLAVLQLSLQYTTSEFRLSPTHRAWGALHAVNAMLLFLVAVEIARRASARYQADSSPTVSTRPAAG